MYFPQHSDYIDIHVHDGTPASGIFILECLMAHEKKTPQNIPGVSYTYGIHPWFLNEGNEKQLLTSLEKLINNPDVIAIGEAGFDKIRGPSLDLQRRVFEKQIAISEEVGKPVVIHCVKAWEELLAAQKKLKPEMPWLIHGFRGNVELAGQLISKGMFLSFWFDFVLRPESAGLLRALPENRVFLETDGADIDIRDIYNKVSNDKDITVEELKRIILSNYKEFFGV